jgi:hypothetical protein
MPRAPKGKATSTFRISVWHERGDKRSVQKLVKMKPNEAAALLELATADRTTQSEVVRTLLRREYQRRQAAAQLPTAEATQPAQPDTQSS